MKSGQVITAFLTVAVSVILLCFLTAGAFAQVSIAIGANDTLAVNGNMDILLSGDWCPVDFNLT